MTDIIAIAIGIAAMLILASGIIFFVVLYQRRVIKHHEELNALNKQKELELVQASVQGEEDERMRIASELHDDVGATLASVKLFLHSQNNELGDKPVFVQSRDLIDETIKKVRDLSHRLQPAVLKQLGLGAALKSFFEPLNRTGEIQVQYAVDNVPRMADNTELAVYRIVQELTNNTIKHSGAKQIVFSCTIEHGTISAKFMHDGEGLTDHTFQEHVFKKDAIGLKNIITRLKSVDGQISFEAANNMSVTKITIPV